MRFEDLIENGKVKKIKIDIIRAKGLYKSSLDNIEAINTILITEKTSKLILRELYESLRQMCEAIGYTIGFKFLDHISITYFLRDYLKEENIAEKFDRYRKIRNKINYYGEEINIKTVKEAKKEINKIILELKKKIKNNIN